MSAVPDPLPTQVIPRPPFAKPGSSGPWESLEPERRRGFPLDRVLAALEISGQLGPVPVTTDGDAMFKPWVEAFDNGSGMGSSVTSAVLVALFEEEGETKVLLTRRAANLRSHKGEVSFPGGRLEPGESIPEGARREAFEEVALDPGFVNVVGWLHPLLTFQSGSLIMPVVATLKERPHVMASPAEVARIFDVSLAQLLGDGVFHEERWEHPDQPPLDTPDGAFPVWFFETAGEIIWGATARMLYELLLIVLGIER
jgi:8-oxo-dGTP pyrophosphatase MutT (NUDIX family)